MIEPKGKGKKKMSKKLSLVSIAFPFAAIADMVTLRHETYFWAVGTLEGLTIALACVFIVGCGIWGARRKWSWVLGGGVALIISVAAFIAYFVFMSICNSCGGLGHSVGRGLLLGGEGESRIECSCCNGRGFHFPWRERCIANPTEKHWREMPERRWRGYETDETDETDEAKKFSSSSEY